VVASEEQRRGRERWQGAQFVQHRGKPVIIIYEDTQHVITALAVFDAFLDEPRPTPSVPISLSFLIPSPHL
jgi:hypothetical protein